MNFQGKGKNMEIKDCSAYCPYYDDCTKCPRYEVCMEEDKEYED